MTTSGESRILQWRPARLSAVAVVAILIAGLLTAGGLATVVLREPPVYQSVATLLIDQPSVVVKATNEGPVVKLNQLRAKYGIIARTTPITEPVGQKLGIPPGQVAAATSVSLPGPSLVLIVAARTTRPQRAREIADGVAEQLKVFLAGEQTGIAEADRIIFRTLASARPGVKVEPTRGRAIVSGAVGGILVLIGGFVLYQLLARRRGRA